MQQPMYRSMDSFPYQRGPMPYGHHVYPSFEAIPPQMKGDAPGSPITYKTWPYGGNYGQTFPVGCHGCCSHGYIPGYCGFRPPHLYYPPPSMFYYHRGYPSLPDGYPVHHVPPPHYSMEQPRYEYDKNLPSDHHCCGCPNHPCYKKEDRRLRIEEQELDSEKKINEEKRGSNSLVPVEFKNSPYPVFWIPPGYVNNGEQRNPTESEQRKLTESEHDKRNNILRPSDQESNAWSGWLPYDMNNIGTPKQCGDIKRTQNQQNEDNFASQKHVEDRKRTQNQLNDDENQFPFPIFWMPYKPVEELGDHAEAEKDRESVEKPPSDLKASADSVSVDDSMDQPSASKEKVDNGVGLKTTEKKSSGPKTIPVKQLEEHGEKRMVEEAEDKARGSNVKDGRENLAAETGSKRRSASPPKASKLPPVCLRVDPLPKKRNGNGNSRSPSTPGLKGKPNKDNDVKSPSGSNKKPREVEANGKERKVVEVVDGFTRQEGGEECKVHSQPEVNVPVVFETGNEANSVKPEKDLRDKEEKEYGEPIQAKDETVKGQSESNAEKAYTKEGNEVEKNFSETEAAVVIQSAYRGYEVRRWEPLKKLKEIAEVRERDAEVRSQIEALECSSPISSNDRQRVIIGETIMGLLLILDTIQGLHPIVRDVRKSIAKELVNLQVRIDRLNCEKSEASISKAVEDHHMNTGEHASIQGGEMEAGNASADHNDDNKLDSLEPCQELTTGPKALEDSKVMFIEKDACEKPEDQMAASHLRSSEDAGKTAAEQVNELGDGLNEKMLDDAQVMKEHPSKNVVLNQAVDPLPLVADQSFHFKDIMSRELPIDEPHKNEQIETGGSEVLQGRKVESLTELGVAEIDKEQQPLDELKEEQVIEDKKDESGMDSDLQYHDEAGSKQDEPLAQPLSHIEDNEEIPNAEEEVSLRRSEPSKDDSDETEVFTEQTRQEGSLNELLDKHEHQELRAELPSTQNELHNKEKSKMEEPCPDIELKENEAHIKEAPNPEFLQAELLPLDEFGGQEAIEPLEPLVELHDKKEDAIGMNCDNCQKEEVINLGGTEGGDSELKVVTVEDNQEFVSAGLRPEEPTGSDKVIDGPCGSETAEEAPIKAEFIPANVEPKVLESVAGNEMATKEPRGSETAKEEAINESQSAQPLVEEELLPVSPFSSHASYDSNLRSENDKKLLEENEKLRAMMAKLIEAGERQLITISNLSGRVKDLEKRLASRKRLRTKRVRTGPSCIKPSNNHLTGRAPGIKAYLKSSSCCVE